MAESTSPLEQREDARLGSRREAGPAATFGRKVGGARPSAR